MTSCNVSCNVSKSSLRALLQSRFVIDCNNQIYLQSYFLRYWTQEYTLRKISEGLGTIKIDGVSYIAIYHRTTRGRILQLSQEEQLALSFREPAPEFGLPAYVLISQCNFITKPLEAKGI